MFVLNHSDPVCVGSVSSFLNSFIVIIKHNTESSMNKTLSHHEIWDNNLAFSFVFLEIQ